MSLITAVYVPTGIVLSGDSRTTGAFQRHEPDPSDPTKQVTVQTNILLSDATDKVFLIDDKYGIGTYGDALIGQLPIAHYVDQLQARPGRSAASTVGDMAQELLNYFASLVPVPASYFVVAGYDGPAPDVRVVDVKQNAIKRVNVDATGNTVYGAQWGGDIAIVNRLLANVVLAWEAMNVQDAVDFSRHLIRSTIDQLRFEPRFPTVGGRIDTLLMTPKQAQFLEKKKLSTT